MKILSSDCFYFVIEETVEIPVRIAEVPSLHQLNQYLGHMFGSNDKRGLMSRPRELFKHTSIREPVSLSCTHEGQVQIGYSVPAPGGETDCTFWIVEQH